MIKKAKLGEVADLSIGFVGTVTTQYEEGGIPFLRTLNVKPYKIVDDDLKRITKEFHESQKKSQLMEGDVAMVHTGVPGICCVIPEEYNNSNCIDMIVIKPHKNEVNAHYLAAYMNTIGCKHIEKQQVGCIQKHFNLKDAADLEIFLPDIETQNRIGEIVYIINSKIENNNKINAELESMAKTIYDYWFLQFEFPNEEGKSYKSSGGKMVWNEELKREIPEGWEVNNLAKAIFKSKNGDWGNEEPVNDDDIKVNCFRGADFISITNDYQMTAPIRYIKKNNADRLLEDGDLVTEISGGSPTQATGRIGYINQGFLNRSENVMDCSNFCKAFTPIDRIYQYWLYQTWKSYYDNGAMFNYESKTTGIKNLMFDDFIDNIYVAYPNEELLEVFQNKCTLFYEKIQKNLLENQELASLRDFLLPMLMNGQIGFKDGE